MKFKDDKNAEKVQNKKLFMGLLNSWYGPFANEVQSEEGKDLVIKFAKLKNRLSPTQSEVKAFLNRFDGSGTSSSIFITENLKDITKYTIDQLRFLIEEYFPKPSDPKVPPPDDGYSTVFQKDPREITPNYYEESKKLWYGEKFTMYSEPGFRVYHVNSQKMAINFGYYQGLVAKSSPFSHIEKSHMQWCIGREQTTQNLWGNYRDRRTFYYVIDESKHPDIEPDVEINQYYQCVVQFATDSETDYRVTSILNDGTDPVVSKDFILSIYPKLSGVFNNLVKVEYSPTDELNNKSTKTIDLINETEGNLNAFWRVNGVLRSEYISLDKPIRKSKSWETMTDSMKNGYINRTTDQTVNERFSTTDLFNKIKESNQEFKHLDSKLLGLGVGGVTYLVETLILSGFNKQRKSKLNNDVHLIKSKSTGNFGLFNFKLGEWVSLNGVTYSDKYSVGDICIYYDANGKYYLVEPYVINNEGENTTFYAVAPGDNIKDLTFVSYFISSHMWNSLKTHLNIEGVGSNNFGNANLSEASDI